MQKRIDEILAGNESRDTLRYMIYSGHDDGISNTLLFLNPVNFQFEDVPYGSQIYYELFYDENCLKTQKNSQCFTIKIAFNGHPLKLSTCQESNVQQGLKTPFCQFNDFVAHYDKAKF